MASLLDHIEYLSKEIGARPAGTEEEQQAALYIAEQFQKEASFPATIEEFTSSSNLEGANAILAVVTFVMTVLAVLFNVLTIPAFILATIAAVIFALEAFDMPILSKALARGASQNVVAKYQPFPQEASKSGRGRSRKVVLVAHYDTGKVAPGIVQRVQATGLPIGLISVGGMIAAALLLFIRIFAGSADGFGGVLLLVLTILALLVVLLPIVKAVLYHLAPYNEGANNNASGVAAIIEVARRISRGSVSEADLAANADGVTIHGEAAAIEGGLVPEGARIVYEAEQLKPPEEIGEYDEEERLLSAKAAIAALTGKPVERKIYGSVADRLVNSRAHALPDDEEPPEGEAAQAGEPTEERSADLGEAIEGNEAPAVEKVAEAPAQVEQPRAFEPPAPVAPTADAAGFENAPSWFITAQKNAKRPTGETGPIQRSRYTEAIETAERATAERERARAEAERRQAEEARRAREEAARAAIVAAHIGEREDAHTASDDQQAAAPAEIAPAAAPANELPAVDPGVTVAHAPVSLEELKREMEAQNESGFIAPPEEFTMPQRRFELPKIEDKPKVAENTSPSRSGLLRRLRTDVPSLSGIIRMQAAGEDVSQKPQEEDPLLKLDVPDYKISLDPDLDGIDTIVDDVDYNMTAAIPAEHEAEPVADVAPYEEQPYDAPVEEEIPLEQPATSSRPSRRTRTTARSSARGSERPDYEPNEMEMPSSRAGGFFSRLLGRKSEPLEETPQQWLDVDEDFDARTVGRERGGWESFRDDQYDDDFDQYDDFDDDAPKQSKRRWNGGSFSRVRLGHVDMRSGEDSDADEQEPLIEEIEDQELAEDIEQIYHFRNPLFNTEVWFVAIGSDTDLHDGARAFVTEHQDELRGSMIVEVESLGVGELAYASEEGRYRKIKASSRVKRYMRQATAVTGISPSTVSLFGSDSITTVLQKAHCQTMHLFGEEDGRPALKGSADDVLENIDELTLDENVNFLLELVKRG